MFSPFDRSNLFPPVQPGRSGGFTLIELLITISILAILLSLGAPSFSKFVRDGRIQSRSDALYSLLTQSRAEAIAQRRVVTVCGSLDGASCNNAGWSTRWISFIDLNGDGVVSGGANPDVVVRSIESNEGGITTFSSANVVRFNAQGFSIGAAAGSLAVTLTLCDGRGNRFAKAVLVTPTGRVSRASDTDTPADGVVNDVGGANVAVC